MGRLSEYSQEDQDRINGIQPVCSLTSTEAGFRAVCTCGWKGTLRDRMSDDYAWTNASNDVKSHERTHVVKS